MHRRHVLAAGLALIAAPARAAAPPVRIAAAAWLAGRWTGEGLGGVAEEMWSPPVAGAMVGHFQLVRDGALVFYEIMQIAEADAGLVFRVKHFNADLTGWEDKAQMVTFPFLAADAQSLRFRGLTLERTGEDAMVVTVTIRNRDGAVRDEPFRFTRA